MCGYLMFTVFVTIRTLTSTSNAVLHTECHNAFLRLLLCAVYMIERIKRCMYVEGLIMICRKLIFLCYEKNMLHLSTQHIGRYERERERESMFINESAYIYMFVNLIVFEFVNMCTCTGMSRCAY